MTRASALLLVCGFVHIGSADQTRWSTYYKNDTSIAQLDKVLLTKIDERFRRGWVRSWPHREKEPKIDYTLYIVDCKNKSRTQVQAYSEQGESSKNEEVDTKVYYCQPDSGCERLLGVMCL